MFPPMQPYFIICSSSIPVAASFANTETPEIQFLLCVNHMPTIVRRPHDSFNYLKRSLVTFTFGRATVGQRNSILGTSHSLFLLAYAETRSRKSSTFMWLTDQIMSFSWPPCLQLQADSRSEARVRFNFLFSVPTTMYSVFRAGNLRSMSATLANSACLSRPGTVQR